MISLQKEYKNRVNRFFLVLAVVLLLCFSFFLVIRYLFPIVIIIILSALLQKPIRIFQKMFHVSKLLAAILSLFLIITLISVITTVAVHYLIDTVSSFSQFIPIFLEDTFAALTEFVNYLGDTLFIRLERLLNRFHVNLSGQLNRSISNFYTIALEWAQQLSNQIFPLLSKLLIQAAQVTSQTFVILIGTLLMSKDWESYKGRLTKWMPAYLYQTTITIKNNLTKTTFAYFKAQLLVSGITSIIMMIGFSFIGIKNSIWLGILFGMIDLIPFVGVGLLLWPWLSYTLISGQFSLTIKLAIVYIIVVCLRQLTEPRLISQHVGINPLYVILIGYFNYTIMGLLGIILTPFLLITLQALKASQLDRIIWTYIKTGTLIR
ncbi:AI-2E family transporter [Amphibacillus sediminis]|uniref:AI-2E family transporter n=1 Tax=Amphibacillus sediminis TaxID=360185 RepID=UPI00082A14C2|nr:AI-2E family transporter [Amphibacillus sediminis]